MKHSYLALFLSVMLALTGLTACSHTSSGSSPESAASAQQAASTAETDAQADAQSGDDQASAQSGDAQDNDKDNKAFFEKHFNPSYTARPVKEAFYNQVELKLDGKFTHAATVAAVISDMQKQTCPNECGSTIHFEDPSISPIPVKYALNLELTNLGDLNGDGNDELGAIPTWWTSTWQAYHIFVYQNGEWFEMFLPQLSINIEYHAEHPYMPVEKSATPGKVIIRDLNPDTWTLEEHEEDIPAMFMDYNQSQPATN